MNMDGWIKLHRRLIDHWIFQDGDYLKAWLTLLLYANHKPTEVLINKHLYKVNKGQLLWSQSSLATHLRWSRGKLKRFLKLLEDEQMIKQKTDSKTTMITICKWESYQQKKTADKPSRGTTDGHHVVQLTDITWGTDKNEKKNKNVKNEKENKQNFDFIFFKKFTSLPLGEYDQSLVFSPPPELMKGIEVILEEFNSKTGKNYPVPQNKLRVLDVIAHGYTLKDCIDVRDDRIEKAKKNKVIANHLRPSTVYQIEKFSNYINELGPEKQVRANKPDYSEAFKKY